MTSADDADDNDNDEGASAAVIYVYGIVPADVQPEDDATGVHDAPIEIVEHGDIAALVSEIDRTNDWAPPRTCRPTPTSSTAPRTSLRCCRCGSVPSCPTVTR